MKFPYGMSSFYNLITEGYWFIDRTAIRRAENIGKILLFLRPRCFGKSMWLSILENYYDVAKADDFERLDGKLAIGQNPTPRHNQYLIMRWDFSTVMSHGTVEDIAQALPDHINTRVRIFADNYKNILKEEITFNPHNGLVAFDTAVSIVSHSPYKLYLLIDEYDNFANEMLMSRAAGSQNRYESFVHGEGILRTLFKAVKSIAGGQGLDRIFITGVSPIVMSDVTSAFNIAEDIYRLSDFNDLCGFWETEVETVLQDIAQSRNMSVNQATEALTVRRSFYNGYTFDGDQKVRLYNPTGEYQSTIPNIVVRRLYAERFREMIFPDAYDRDVAREKAAALFQRGDMQPLCDFMEHRYFKVFGNRDDRWAKEMTIKTAFLTLLFNDIFYIMDSETTLHRGYADLTMILRPDMRKFALLDILIEFKYVKPQAGKVNQTEIAELPMTELAQLKTVKKQLDEAKGQVTQHRHVLQEKYGEVLPLSSFAVVALGFERLVWEEV